MKFRHPGSQAHGQWTQTAIMTEWTDTFKEQEVHMRSADQSSYVFYTNNPQLKHKIINITSHTIKTTNYLVTPTDSNEDHGVSCVSRKGHGQRKWEQCRNKPHVPSAGSRAAQSTEAIFFQNSKGIADAVYNSPNPANPNPKPSKLRVGIPDLHFLYQTRQAIAVIPQCRSYN